MRSWTDWEIVRHQVAICGRVVDAGDSPVEKAEVRLATVPEEFERRYAGSATTEDDRDDVCERPDRTLTNADGNFYFLDLPAGRYNLRATTPRSSLQAEKAVSVVWDAEGTVVRAVADFTLSMTSS